MPRKPRIGIALGGGSARGWAHIGVLQYLRSMGIVPEVVCGTSIGSIVGAAEVTEQLDALEDWVLRLKWQDILSYLDLSFTGGLIEGGKLIDFFRDHFSDRAIEDLPRPFGAIATELASGQEQWLTEGSMLTAIRASIALPGLFTPSEVDGRWLVDGGLVNPVPVSLCRALGADRIIAVDLNADILRRRGLERFEGVAPAESRNAELQLAELLKQRDWRGLFSAALADSAVPWSQLVGGNGAPSLVDVITQSVYIMQVRITRARMAGDPPDVLLTPRLGDIRLMEFHRGAEAMAAGRRAAEQAREQIEALAES
ncbi:patatin-like phospholipase RssA [Thiohalobacter sp. IOR34]|uniref:patatin-like phospholipase RssA n=1 Tax=Thiohalobacter sp. IOR34 TaxID=3057176 RepID=UPI0025B227F6|nr:patatin-like phospholipase RssA [Thiohalobacter sp. IOR34]WJW76755.1 patatin-like phospholipase RssA [Thiohalobacter sp. IOR34]